MALKSTPDINSGYELCMEMEYLIRSVTSYFTFIIPEQRKLGILKETRIKWFIMIILLLFI